MKYLSICILFFAYSWSQSKSTSIVEIEYENTKKTSKGSDSKYIKYYDLKIYPSENISIYDIIENKEGFKENKSSNQNSIEWKPVGKNLNTLYKDYNKNEMYLKNMISFRFFCDERFTDHF